MKAAIDSVTNSGDNLFGAATVAAAAVDEVAIVWVKKPSTVATTETVTVSGSTDVAGFVYCMLQKSGEKQPDPNAPATRRLVDEEPDADDTADTDDTAFADDTEDEENVAADAYKTMLVEDDLTATYYFQRKETAADAFTFTFTFKAASNTKYGWGCQATSSNPNSALALYKSTAEGGTVTTEAPEVEDKGDSALLGSLFAAIIMIVGVFFY